MGNNNLRVESIYVDNDNNTEFDNLKTSEEIKQLISADSKKKYFTIELHKKNYNLYHNLPDADKLVPYFRENQAKATENEIGTYVNYCTIDYGTFEIDLPYDDRNESLPNTSELKDSFEVNNELLPAEIEQNSYKSFASD